MPFALIHSTSAPESAVLVGTNCKLIYLGNRAMLLERHCEVQLHDEHSKQKRLWTLLTAPVNGWEQIK
jgi:hypothetical protein